MNYRRMLLAAGAVTALSGLANAQVPINWIDNMNSGSLDVAFSGTGLFGAFGGGQFSGIGDSIQRCYTIDQVTGGNQSSTGLWKSPAFRVYQGFGAAAPTLDFGVVSMRLSTVDALSGDACFTPLADTLQPVAPQHKQAALALIGQPFAPGVLAPFGTVYGITFTWVTPVTAANLIGTDSGSSFPNTPLIGTLVFEVQGPVNEGPNNNQYYLGSTSERPGTSATAPGGSTNGNNALASAITGVDAVTSEALSHTRLTAFNVGTGTLNLAIPALIGQPQPGALEFFGAVAWDQAVLHGINDGNDGPGGNDWNVSTSPVTTPDLRVMDVLAGQQQNPADPGSVGTLAFNQSWFLWSATPANGTSQGATSWCTYASAPGVTPPSNGDPLLGPQVVSRYAVQQTIPVCFDPLFVSFLGKSPLSLGKQYTQASSTVAAGGANNNILFQGGFNPITDGLSDVTGLGGGPLLAAPDPSLADTTLGVANVGLQLDVAVGFFIQLTEFASAAELNLQ